MISIYPRPNMPADKRFMVVVDLTNNGLGFHTHECQTIFDALKWVEDEMNKVVPT